MKYIWVFKINREPQNWSYPTPVLIRTLKNTDIGNLRVFNAQQVAYTILQTFRLYHTALTFCDYLEK